MGKRDEDNYAISERDETSDNEGEMIEPDRCLKPVPRWCANYLQLLSDQQVTDPDSIFGTKVPSCDLEKVFPDELYNKCRCKRPQRKRGSSGEWKRDRLRGDEIDAYNVKMGHKAT